MGINKVVYGNDTLIDISEDTVTADDVVNTATFHTADGVQREGTITNYRDTDVDCIGGIDEKKSQVVMVIENEWGILDFLNAVVNLSTRFVCSLTDIIPKLGNAKPSDVKKGVVFSSNQGIKLVGTYEEVAPESKVVSGKTSVPAGTDGLTIETGFRPKMIMIEAGNSLDFGSPTSAVLYNEDVDNTKYWRSISSQSEMRYIGDNIVASLKQVTDTGFTYRGVLRESYIKYYAVG